MDEAQTQPRPFTLPERIAITRRLRDFGLGHLRLPGITIDTVCHGLANGCTCPDCTADPQPADQQPTQPWEPKPARHAA